nr:hypothetical protein [Bordetella genomosp. 1]
MTAATAVVAVSAATAVVAVVAMTALRPARRAVAPSMRGRAAMLPAPLMPGVRMPRSARPGIPGNDGIAPHGAHECSEKVHVLTYLCLTI